MNIKDFLKETIVQISEGIKKANSELKEKKIKSNGESSLYSNNF